MNRIDFDDGELYELEKKCVVIAETMSRGESECRNLSESVTVCVGMLSGEITREIKRVQERLGQARALAGECAKRAKDAVTGIRDLPDMPKPNFSTDPERRAAEDDAYRASAEKASRERERVGRENERCREEERRMKRAEGEAIAAAKTLESMIGRLYECLNTVSGVSASFENTRARTLNGLHESTRDMDGFNLALKRTRDVAREILSCRNTAYNIRLCDGDFVISTVGHEGRIAGASGTVTSGVTATSQKSGDAELVDMGGGAVGIPAARLYELGGSGLLAEMEEKGYSLRKENGSMISAGGYIVWEKKSET